MPYLQLPLISRVEGWRSTQYKPVSSPRLVKPGVRFSRTGLSCYLHLKDYGTYRLAALSTR